MYEFLGNMEFLEKEWNIYMFVCVFVYMYIHIYMYVSVYACVCVYVNICIYIYLKGRPQKKTQYNNIIHGSGEMHVPVLLTLWITWLLCAIKASSEACQTQNTYHICSIRCVWEFACFVAFARSPGDQSLFTLLAKFSLENVFTQKMFCRWGSSVDRTGGCAYHRH